MKVGARLVFRLPDPAHGRQPICLLLIAYNRRSLCQNCAQRHECAFRVRNRRNVIDISVKLERTEYQQMEAQFFPMASHVYA